MLSYKHLKYYIKEIMLAFESRSLKKKREELFDSQLEKGLRNIPVFIISFNRLSYVKSFVEQLEERGFENINIIDNASSYKPLLDYYKRLKHKIFIMDKNYGYKVFWQKDIFDEYRKDFFIVTDPDLHIPEICPDDFIDKFFATLRKHPYVRKVGFSLKTDDLPPNTKISNDVLNWEKQFRDGYIKNENMYYAEIDTTFALYMPEQFVKNRNFISAYRLGKPYEIKHLPWYKDENSITEEDVFYSELKTNGWSDPVKGFAPD